MAFVLTSVTIPSAAPSLSGWLTCLWRINWLHYMQLPQVSLGPTTLVRVHTPPCECASASHSAVWLWGCCRPLRRSRVYHARLNLIVCLRSYYIRAGRSQRFTISLTLL